MKIYIINITILWIYRLYEEYIISLKKFILNNYNNIEVIIITYDEDNFIDDIIDDDIFMDNNKIFYSGNFDIYNNLLNKYQNINKIIYNNNFFFINIEQMSIPSYYNLLLKNLEKGANHNIIDYSEENIPFLNDKMNTFLYPPYFKSNNIKITEKTIDLLSLSNNEYRKEKLNIINESLNIINNKNNNNIKNIQNICSINGVYGQQRNEYFYKTKIYINIHCSDEHQTMELIRILNLISYKVIVISQKSIISDLLFIKDKIIICNNISNFSEYINEILNNYEYYFNKIYGNFEDDEQEYIKYIKNNLDKIINS